MAQTNVARLRAAYGLGSDNGTPALTAVDNSTVNGSYNTTEANVIQNNRTRIDEIIIALRDLGYIG